MAMNGAKTSCRDMPRHAAKEGLAIHIHQGKINLVGGPIDDNDSPGVIT